MFFTFTQLSAEVLLFGDVAMKFIDTPLSLFSSKLFGFGALSCFFAKCAIN